jgi:flavodoxin
MKIAVRYQSRGNNTKVVAEAIAKAAGVTAESVEKPLAEPVDLLFVGGGVYMGGIDQSLKTFLENLDPKLVKSAAAFTTAGGQDKTKAILSAVKSRGINAESETLPIKLYLRNHAWLGGKGKIKLTEKQVQSVNNFVNKLINREIKVK